MDEYLGRYYTKIGLNIALLIFPLSIAFMYAQRFISMPLSTRIIVVKLILLTVPNILGIVAIAFGFKGYKEDGTRFGMFVLILSLISMLIMLWFAFWVLNDLSFIYRYGFLTPK